MRWKLYRQVQCVSDARDSFGVLVHLDDIIVFGCSFEEHLNRFDFKRIKKANSIKYCKNRSCWKISFPPTIRRLKAFMGLVGFYRKFGVNFGVLADPLFHLMNKAANFQ